MLIGASGQWNTSAELPLLGDCGTAAPCRDVVNSGGAGLRHGSCQGLPLQSRNGLLRLHHDPTCCGNYCLLDHRKRRSVKERSGLSSAFLLSYGLGVIFLEPWTIGAWQELGMFAITLVMLALWVAGGCIFGAVPAALIVSLTTKLRQRIGA